MRKIFISFSLLALILLISSCGDILNPEPDTHTSKIKYHTMLKDQEHSVIMPLKVGNMWIYKVSSVSYDGKTEFIGYDTLIVKRDTIIKGEKWFIAKDPSSTDKEVVLTNTDIGLICNPDCFCGLLRAEYPAKYSTYLYMAGDYPTQVPYYNDQGELIDTKIVYAYAYFWMDVESIDDYTIFNKTFGCLKYQMRGYNKLNGKIHSLSHFQPTIEYFIPDLGLVRKDFCNLEHGDIINIIKRIELIYTNVKI